MPRQVNAVDFWRGFALLTIFINHVPGITFERFTFRNVSIADSADLFVFLAGWSVRYLVASAPVWPLTLRLTGRALQLYAAHIMIITIAIAMLAAAATLLNNPLLLEWHNAAAVFQDPVSAHIGLAVLTHQLGYFDILPLYVVLLALAPVLVLIDRYAPTLLLPLSATAYLATLVFQISVPSWPVSGRWFFNPLAWQFLFVLGFVLARPAGPGGWVRRNLRWLRVLAIPIVVAGALMVQFSWWPNPTQVPSPRLLFIADKSFLTPLRLIQFLALIALFSAAFPYLKRPLGPVVGFLSLLGRNSLNVFCVGSLLSLAGQIARYIFKGGFGIDVVVLGLGVALLGLTGWLSEWRERARKPASRPAASSA